MIRLAVIGCGSVVQQYHVPALADVPELQLAGLVDVNPQILAPVQARWPVGQAVTDFRALRDVDAVLIATPHSLHAEMCAHFLAQGIHVLVEKPMVLQAADAAQLIDVARARRAVFAVGVFRRYYPASRLVKTMLQQEWLGGVVAIDAEEGGHYDWELQSRYLLDRRLAGGGVLVDTGSHLVDRLLWWLTGAEIRLVDYLDDSTNGVEADCELRFNATWQGREIPCRVELSRTRTLRNTIRLTMKDGWVELGANTPNGLRWSSTEWARETDVATQLWLQSGTPDDAPALPQAYFQQQWADFARAIATGSTPLNHAASNLPTVQLLAECYRVRRPLPEPWNQSPAVKGGQP